MKNLSLMAKLLTKILAFFMVLVSFLIHPGISLAHCPLCVAGAAAGVTLTRWIGVDDSITGVWIAAVLGAMSFWLFNWLLGRKIKIIEKNRELIRPAIYILIWGMTLWSFYKFQLIIRMSQIWGLDKLTFGMLAGGTLFYLVDSLKIKHYFNYQKIVVSLGSMTILSLLIYILINFFI